MVRTKGPRSMQGQRQPQPNSAEFIADAIEATRKLKAAGPQLMISIGPTAKRLIKRAMAKDSIIWDRPPSITTPERYIDIPYFTKPNGKRGRQPTYHAKIGTHGSTTIIVRRARSFIPGQRVQYAELSALSGMCIGCTPQWQGGVVREVRDTMLFIDRM